jgi:HEPN domain-containing protein
MGIADLVKSISNLFKHDVPVSGDLLPDEHSLLEQISKLNDDDKELTPELYQQLREYEERWLERHYDFNTIEGINAIPDSKDLPGAPAPRSSIKSHTGEVYYYIRRKAYLHEDAGNIDLALACMRKSVALVKCRPYFSSDDLLPLVKMLARAGYVEEAYAELRSVEQIFSTSLDCDREIEAEIRRGCEQRDFQWIQANYPDKCPKSVSSFRRMKTQNTKNYQVLQSLAAEQGRII